MPNLALKSHFLCMLFLATTCYAGSDSPVVFDETAFRSIVGIQVASKISLGSFMVVVRNYSERPTRYVDTEVYPNGEVKYLVRFGEGRQNAGMGDIPYEAFYVVPGHEPYQTQLQMLKRGSTFVVEKIDLKNNRIELPLRGEGGEYAKIKLMLGEGYKQQISAESVIAQLSKVATSSGIDHFVSLQTAIASLTQDATRLHSEMQGSSSAQERLQAATKLRRLVNQLQTANGELASITRTAPSVLAMDTAALDNAIAQLRPEADAQRRREQFTDLKEQFGRNQSESQRIIQALSAAAPSSTEECQSLRAAASRLSSLDAQQAQLQNSFHELGSVPPEIANYSPPQPPNSYETKCDRLQLADLQKEFAELQSQKKAALSDYARSYGTARQSDASSQLIVLIQRMQLNRTDAAQLKLAGAEAQAKALEKELESITK